MSKVKIQALRFGSIVHYKGRTCTVGTVNGASTLYLYDVTDKNERPIVAMLYETKGVPAYSTQVLRKLGFTESGVTKNYEFGPISYNPGEKNFYFNNVMILYKVHIHQLQNLAYDWMENDHMLKMFQTYKEQQ